MATRMKPLESDPEGKVLGSIGVAVVGLDGREENCCINFNSHTVCFLINRSHPSAHALKRIPKLLCLFHLHILQADLLL